MLERTLTPLAALILLALAACGGSDVGSADLASPDPTGWRMSSGKAPSQAEFAALAATCQVKGGAVDSCFNDLGLKRAR